MHHRGAEEMEQESSPTATHRREYALVMSQLHERKMIENVKKLASIGGAALVVRKRNVKQ